jgi:hypothetical protein
MSAALAKTKKKSGSRFAWVRIEDTYVPFHPKLWNIAGLPGSVKLNIEMQAEFSDLTERYGLRQAELIYKRFLETPKSSLEEYFVALFEAAADMDRLYWSMMYASVFPHRLNFESLIGKSFDVIRLAEKKGLLTFIETEWQLTIVTKKETVTLPKSPQVRDAMANRSCQTTGAAGSASTEEGRPRT